MRLVPRRGRPGTVGGAPSGARVWVAAAGAGGECAPPGAGSGPGAPAGRGRQVKLRYSEEELGDVAAAAARSGLTPAGFAAEAALAAARGTSPPACEPWRDALLEVMAARTQVRRFGTNVNQAVRGAERHR